jgi:hypothetical protein
MKTEIITYNMETGKKCFSIFTGVPEKWETLCKSLKGTPMPDGWEFFLPTFNRRVLIVYHFENSGFVSDSNSNSNSEEGTHS